MGDLGDQPFAFQASKIISRLPTCVDRAQKGTHMVDQLSVGEARDRKTEPDQGAQNRHHTLFPKPKSCGIKTIIGGRRSGHLAKGGRIGSGSRVCGFGITQTPVGGFANQKGRIMLDPASDRDVIQGQAAIRHDLLQIAVAPMNTASTTASKE
jgi:hypothetical protein